MKRSGTISRYLSIAFATWALLNCQGQSEDASSQVASLLLASPLIQPTNQSACAGPGTLRLFTDPMPPENEIQVIQLGESIVLDQSGYPGSPNLVWDFLAGTEYLGFYQRYARHVPVEQCAAFTPTFPGFHYLKVCNEVTCLARGIFKVEGEMNKAPTAVLKPIPLVVPVGIPIALDLSESTDPENDELKFSWQLHIKPNGSSTTSPAAGPALQTFTPDVPGKYFMMGRARDGFENPFRFLDEAKSQITGLFYARIPGNAAPEIEMSMTPLNPTEATGIKFDASASTDSDDASIKIHYWALIRQNASGSWEYIRDRDDFANGELTFEIAPEAGKYAIYVCLADYVGRESGLEGEEQSCTEKEFTVTP